MAESYHENIGDRVFNIVMEGNQAVCDIDIIKIAGKPLTATSLSYNINVLDEVLNLSFEPGRTENPKINAIEIFPIASTSILSNLPSSCPMGIR